MADRPQDTPNEDIEFGDRIDQGAGVWYNTANHLYESKDAEIQGTNPGAVVQYTDPALYVSSGLHFHPADNYYWEHQPKALQKLRASVTPDLSRRSSLAVQLQSQGYEIDWQIHVQGVSPASIMWQRERWRNQSLTDIFNREIKLPYLEIPKNLPYPGVLKAPAALTRK